MKPAARAVRAGEAADLHDLGDVDPQTLEVARPSFYAELVWDCRKKKAQDTKKPIDWVVMRNRMSPLDAKNKQRVGEALAEKAKGALAA